MTELLRTALHAEHVAAGATLTPFAGWQMPLRYGGDLHEHRAVRDHAGLFDLSHMAQIEVTGPQAGAALDGAVVSKPSALRPGRARYSAIVNADGGILDDLIVYRLADSEYLMIANAVNRVSVLDAVTVRSHGLSVSVVDRSPHRALIGLQGPAAAGLLTPLTDTDIGTLGYYGATVATVAGIPALIARTGYTGEDGFELAVPAESATTLWRTLVAGPGGATPAGLAARDTLRLEAGMALYGQELTSQTTPYDVGLGRLVDLEHEFIGRAALRERSQSEDGTTLIGLAGTGRRAARAGCTVLDASSTSVGTVTSGVLSPTLGYPIAMARVLRSHQPATGEQVGVDVRGTLQEMTVTDLPFYRRSR
ncbi:MAG: glycine cleavage system aminomethyltransferase GcvT [Beutenbergiaceae bacterium]